MTATPWALGPFSPPLRIAIDGSELRFDCPVIGRTIAWAAKDVFNPSAVVHENRVCLLVRGEDAVGRYAGTSRIGLATSEDGVHFAIEPEPVLFPADDRWQAWEWPGGIEDPRVVASPEGGYVCTYTAFDGKVGCMFVATSPDLRVWTKHGPAFAQTPYVRRPTKSGAIVTALEGGLLVAARLDGKCIGVRAKSTPPSRTIWSAGRPSRPRSHPNAICNGSPARASAHRTRGRSTTSPARAACARSPARVRIASTRC